MRDETTITNKLVALRCKEEEILIECKMLRNQCEPIPHKTTLKLNELNVKISLLKWVLKV